MLLLIIMVCVTIAGCAQGGTDPTGPGGKTETPTSPPKQTTTGTAAATELLDMDWAEIEAQAKKEGSVTYWCWGNEDFYTQLGQAFESKYGIKFNLVVSEQAAGIQKVLTEKDGAVGSFDVIKIGGQTVKPTMDAGVFYGPILSKIEDGDKLDPKLSERQEGVETKGYLVPSHRNQTGLLYNPRKLTNPPQTWAELEAWIDANPKKFGFCMPDKGGSGQAFVLTLINQVAGGLDKYYGDSEVDEAKIENWQLVWQWIKDRMDDRITLTTSNNDSISRLNQGELDLIVAWDDNSFNAISKGELFKDAVLYIPKFGMPGGGDTSGLLKNAPHKAAGLLLINFMSSDEGQMLFRDVMMACPARTDIPATATLLKEEDKQYSIPWIPAEYKKQFIEDFTKYVMMSGN